MEGQHLPRFAAGALGVDADAADAALEVIRRHQDGLERLAVVLAVDGQEARVPGGDAGDRKLQVGGLGHEGDVVLRQPAHRDQRVEHRAVVADEEEGALRQLLQPGEPWPHARVAAEPARDAHADPAAEAVLLFDALARREPRQEQAVDPEAEREKEVRGQKAQREHGQRAPQRRLRGQQRVQPGRRGAEDQKIRKYQGVHLPGVSEAIIAHPALFSKCFLPLSFFPAHLAFFSAG